ncbi:chemotaxis protein CheB [Magnetococcales bacterium HHB-1]
MSVTVQQSADSKQIMVLGEIDSETEALLLTILAEPFASRIALSFFDATMISEAIVWALHRLVTDHPESRIEIYKHTLAHYLNVLNLPVRHKVTAHKPLSYPTIKALALGGSTDSLDKIIYIISKLPVSDLVVFVIQHVSEGKQNRLDHILHTKTDYTLLMPHHMTPVQPGTIYIAPPGHQMRVHHGQVYLTRDRKQNYARPSIDVLFESLAREYGKHLLAVLLCGYGRDGVDALGLVKRVGGWVLVERAEECLVATLVENAVKEGVYDQICSLQEITAFGVAATETALDETMIKIFLKAVYHCYGYAFQSYAYGTLLRRTTQLMQKSGYKKAQFSAFQRDVLTNPLLFEQLFFSLSIGVTQFFRYPKQLAYLRQSVLPELASYPYIRIWVAGCATGEEAYSIAILLDELGLLEKSRIYATDLNPVYLAHGENGLFGSDDLPQFKAHYQQSEGIRDISCYIKDNGRYFAMAPHLQKRILWHRHSLIHDGVFNEFQLILCRNVMIYFNQTLIQTTLNLFARSLHTHGLLMLGEQENFPTDIEASRSFECRDEALKCFQLKVDEP